MSRLLSISFEIKTPINNVIKFVVSLRNLLKPRKVMIVDDFTVTP